MAEIRLLLFILLAGIIFSGVVVLIAKFEKKSSLSKYAPAIILFPAGAAHFVRVRWFSEGMQDLGNIIYAMLAVGSGILTLITAVVIDVFKMNNKERNTK